MERSFAREVGQLALRAGETFRGEGVLAVTKALLQSGVAYVGGYQGSPISGLLDVMVQARGLLEELGVHVEPCTNEAAAAALLAASVAYPVRGAVTWKSIVGTNVASDALSHVGSPGVVGGALIVVGEDTGEGSSVAQERTHAYAMKSSFVLLDPRPDLPHLVDTVERAFALSEASHTPVMLQLRIRACHLQGSFVARDNVAPPVSRLHPAGPAPVDVGRIPHPPGTFAHERLKVAERLPAARRYIAEHGINERFGTEGEAGVIVQGGIWPNLAQALAVAELADRDGTPRLPVLVLNATYPLVPDELAAFCRGKRAVLVLEEGHPAFIEFELAAHLARSGLACAVEGKAAMGEAGEYQAEAIAGGLARFLAKHAPSLASGAAERWRGEVEAARARAAELVGARVPARPPGFCTGCPERPVFSALKLVERELGPRHCAADVGCHSFAMFEPFGIGHTIAGYGMGLASAAAVAPIQRQRPLATVGDGGFWHGGFGAGVAAAVKNGTDAVLLVFENGYSSATGTQELVSTPPAGVRAEAGGRSATAADARIDAVLAGVGVRWRRTVHSYDVAAMKRALEEAFTTTEPGLKVVVAEGECQLERQRRLRPAAERRARDGVRVERVRYGIDAEACTGDRSCVRLSGCPSLTVASSGDPLRTLPATVIDDACVGCGLCGTLAQYAGLCPSFYRVEVVANPRPWERLASRVRARVAAALLPREAAWT